MKKLLLISALAIIAVPSSAQNTSSNMDSKMVVSGARTMERFVQDVNRDLDRSIRRATPQQVGSGVAQVLFECSPDGKTTNIRMYSRSGDFWLDSLARRAVARIKTMHPLPHRVDSNQQYLANIIVANDYWEYQELTSVLEKREAKRIAAIRSGDRKVFAFNLTPSPSS